MVLLEATDRLMGWLDAYFHEVAMEHLGRLGVEVRLNVPVEEASERGVRAGDEWLAARTRVWATGIEIPGPIRDLPGRHDPTGRVRGGRPPHAARTSGGLRPRGPGALQGPAPGLALHGSVAVQQGPWAARDLGRRVRNSASRPPFFDRGYAVSLGPESAVAEALGVRLKGRAAQALYRSVLLYYLKSRRDRILTGADWAMERTLGRVGFEGVRLERRDE